MGRTRPIADTASKKHESVKPYGYELVMDLHECEVSRFKRESLDGYFETICNAIDMQKCERYFWDDFGLPEEEKEVLPHTKGTSAVQFILTSSIVIHTLDLLAAAYINIFSCKVFDRDVAKKITEDWFKARECRTHFIERI